MRNYDIEEAFMQIIGPKSDIEKILSLMYKDEAEKQINKLPDSKYVELFSGKDYYNSVWSGLREKIHENTQDIISKFFFNCEILIFKGYHRRGEYHYCYSLAGSDKLQWDYFYEKSSYGVFGDFDPWPDWLDIIFEGSSDTNKVRVNLNNGRVIEFEKDDNDDLKPLDLLEKNNLTISLLAKTKCDYIVKNKRRSSLKGFQGLINSVDQVEEIIVDTTRLTKDFTSNALKKMSDKSAALFFQSYFKKNIVKVFDFKLNTLTVTENNFIYFPEDIENEKFEYKEVKVNTINKSPKPIAGIDIESCQDFIFDDGEDKESTLFRCLSDCEVIEVPEISQTKKGSIVTEIGELAFEKLTNIEKIILPKTITDIKPDAFKGCRKLKHVVFKNDTDSKDDFVLRSGTRLNTLFTSKTSYKVPKDVYSIGKFAFGSCTKLKTITLHENIKSLTVNSLAECRPLKTIVLTKGVKSINVAALKKAKIKEVVIPDGRKIKIFDEYLFDCFKQDSSGIDFDYKKAAKNISKSSKESARFKTAYDLLVNHGKEIGREASNLADNVIRYAIGKNDAKIVAEIMFLDLSYQLDYSALLAYASKAENPEISSIILEKSNKSGSAKKMISIENPAPKVKDTLHIRVRFPKNRAYSYFCDYDVDIGDKVFVAGKLAGEPGEVVEILKTQPKGRAAMYTLAVESAFNVVMEEMDDDLGDL